MFNQFDREGATTVVQDSESGATVKTQKTSAFMLFSRIFLLAFSLTFFAEWGDRSQLTTVLLAAKEVNYLNSYQIF